MRKKIFRVVSPSLLRWENYVDCMRDLHEEEQKKRWVKAFGKKRKANGV